MGMQKGYDRDMKTRTSPWDYARPLPPASLTVRERERAILGWVGELDGYWKRGLLTMSEYHRLLDEGPREREGQLHGHCI